MKTAKTNIPAGGSWPTGYLIYTHPSGMSSNILSVDIAELTATSELLKIIEVYPTGDIPTLLHTTTGTLMTTYTDCPIENVIIPASSVCGSEVRAICSGNVELYVNYQLTGEDIKSWYGYNTGKQNGRM